MARPTHLVLILAALCAGIVAVPAVTTPGSDPPSMARTPTAAPVRDDFILRVDRQSGCVWRVSVTTGKRELAFRCTGPKRILNNPARRADPESRVSPPKSLAGVPQLSGH
jgi:hypothetical protein